MKNNIKEMEYKNLDRSNPEVLAEGTLAGIRYLVLNYGTHPCAYIELPRSSQMSDECIEMFLPVHGGCTFMGSKIAGHVVKDVDQYLWFGWDYNHFGDYSLLSMPAGVEDMEMYGQKYSTEEILSEVWDAIKWFVFNS